MQPGRTITRAACVGAAALAALPGPAPAQPADAEINYDEAKVPAYTLPDVLAFDDGKKVTSAKDWSRRRAELLERFETHVYGKTPGARPRGMTFKVKSVKKDALGGKADGPRMELLVYVPAAAKKPVPAFLGLNFCGNQCVTDEADVPITTAWVRNNPRSGATDNRATEASRGVQKDRWQIEKVIAGGYATVTAYYGDLDPDFDDGFQNGVQPLFYKKGQTRPEAGGWGAIGAWAWGLSRALDYLETDKDIDARKVAVHGHSRLGKAALWAGAQDPRFAIVISNNSGCGGAALSKRVFGETVKRINKSFPHWFAANFRKYDDNEAALPVDQHQLLALIAPRPVYVASAVEDAWADPRGEFLALKHAAPVWKLLGREGLPADDMPGVDRPAVGGVAYHVRTGKHDVTAYDWQQYVAFADRHFGRAKR
jgi:hypothetical protein